MWFISIQMRIVNFFVTRDVALAVWVTIHTFLSFVVNCSVFIVIQTSSGSFKSYQGHHPLCTYCFGLFIVVTCLLKEQDSFDVPYYSGDPFLIWIKYLVYSLYGRYQLFLGKLVANRIRIIIVGNFLYVLLLTMYLIATIDVNRRLIQVIKSESS